MGHDRQEELRSLLGRFAEHHGRNLLARKRRQLDELMDMLFEHFEEYGVESVSPGPGSRFTRGAVSAGWLVDRLEAFEDGDLADAAADDKDMLRFAETTLRALARWLPRALA
ncbi:hypothetical protein DB30_04023 [Enhygromyxa salina]|uniref:Uncharacterized protein n=1 Tax=Enhygromyxa salina TaxID=215803 RepID=A0A0C2D0U4_9BACT|nr:hypothetical protein DB30_04023 [Enhygromyxa salina]